MRAINNQREKEKARLVSCVSNARCYSVQRICMPGYPTAWLSAVIAGHAYSTPRIKILYILRGTFLSLNWKRIWYFLHHPYKAHVQRRIHTLSPRRTCHMDKKRSSNFRKRKFVCHFFTKSGRWKQTIPSYDLFLYSIQTSSLKYLSQVGRCNFFVLISPDEPGRSWPSRPQNSNSASIQIDDQLADPNQKVRVCAHQ